MKQGVRIIGGKYRGRKLRVDAHEDLRPTGDRMRETLFNWLMHDILEARCLDAFAGSGVLGFEALSRGAKEVVFVEPHPRTVQRLKNNAQEMKVEGANIFQADVMDYLSSSLGSFDIVFMDPPFRLNYWQRCVQTLLANNCLRPNALIYIESPAMVPMDEARWTLLKAQKSGQVEYALYKLKNK